MIEVMEKLCLQPLHQHIEMTGIYQRMMAAMHPEQLNLNGNAQEVIPQQQVHVMIFAATAMLLHPHQVIVTMEAQHLVMDAMHLVLWKPTGIALLVIQILPVYALILVETEE